jgi:hypothetical protein
LERLFQGKVVAMPYLKFLQDTIFCLETIEMAPQIRETASLAVEQQTPLILSSEKI